MKKPKGAQQKYFQRLLADFDSLQKNCQSPKREKQKTRNEYTICIANSQQRQLILCKQFPMQKKGKNFGTEQLRRFKLEIDSDIKLLQIGGKEETKQLPMPKLITKQFMDENRYNKQNKWNQKYKDHMYRLMMQFQQRNPIWVYFTALEYCNQILLCISKHIHSKKKLTFKKSIKLFQSKVKDAFLMKLLDKDRYRRSMQTKKKISQTQLSQLFIKAFSDQSCIRQMGYKWHKKAIYPSQKFQKPCTFKFKKLVTNLKQDLSNGVLKFWLKGQVPWRMKAFNDLQKTSLTQYRFVSLQQSQQVQKNQLSCNLQTGCTMNFQFQHDELGNFKSQRFNLIDLLKKRKNSVIQSVILLLRGNKSLLLYLTINFKCQNTQKVRVTKRITPIHYPMLNQIYSQNFSVYREILVNEGRSIQTISQSIHLHHLKIKHQVQTLSKNQVSLFSSLHSAYRLFQKLNIQALINKFYQAYPFSQYIMVDNKGSFVYKHFVEKSSDLYYYDVQRIIWNESSNSNQINSKHNKRLLNAIKCFDQNPRIIFTNGFSDFVAKNLELAKNLTSEKWILGLFQQSVIGVQSLAFFLTISLLKLASQIFIQQPVVRRSLQFDSLLFHFTLKTAMPKVYYKISSTQINIQALFGTELVSFFSQILPLSLYQLAINSFIEEKQLRKQQGQAILNTGDNQIIQNFCLIGIFLTIIQVSSHYQAAFNSSQSFLIFLRQYFKLLPVTQTLSFKTLFPIKVELVRQCANYSNYIDLKKSMRDFYQQSLVEDQFGHNACSRQLPEIAYQLYGQFNPRKNKNQADLRKIFLIIDKLQIPPAVSFDISFTNQSAVMNKSMNIKGTSSKPKRLILQIFQKNQRLYTHQFQTTDFSKIHHPIQFKLLRLEPLLVSLHYQSHHETYNFKINPRVLASNYYLQFSQQLQCSVTHIYDKKMYVCYQAYIKDSSEIEYIQNRIPEKYINHLIISGKDLNNSTNLLNSSMSSSASQALQKSHSLNNFKNSIALSQPTIKQDIMFCNNFMRTFRMPQNNFNLIYSQLCWYGNHYLIPQQQILQVNVVPNYGNTYLSTGNLSMNKNQPILNQNQQNRYNVHVSQKNSAFIQQQTKILYQVIKYSRCVFGKGILPFPSVQRSVIFGKYLANKIVCEFQPKQGISNFNSIPYDSAQSLSTYVLNNFAVQPNMSFIQFYAKMLRNLPLIHYLTYQPMQYLLLPDIHIQISYYSRNSQQKCSVFLSNTRSKKSSFIFKTQFSEYQMQQIQACSNYTQTLKQVNNISFQYCQKNMRFDQFLKFLKLNILIRGIQIIKSKSKLENQGFRYSADSFIELRRFQLNSKNYDIPNYQIHELFIYLIQTKEKLCLQFKQIQVAVEPSQTEDQSFRQKNQNLIKQNFSNFGHIDGRWTSIAIQLKLQGTSNYFYVQQIETRRRYLLKEQDVIIGQYLQLIDYKSNQEIPRHHELSFPVKKIDRQADSSKNRQNVIIEVKNFCKRQFQKGI